MYSHYKLMLSTYRESLLCLLCLFFVFRLESSCSFVKSSFLPSISNTTHLCSRSQHHFHVIALSVELSWVGWQGCWTLPCQLNVQAFLETREQYYLKDSNKQQHWLLTSRLRTFHARSMWKGAGEYFATSFNAPPCDIVSPYYWTHRLIPSAPSDPQCFPLCMLRV